MNRRALNRFGSALATAVALLLSSSLPAPAQTAGAALQGRVLDEQGHAVPGATLTATNPATGLIRVQTSAADGSYRFPVLPVGTWDLLAERAGFQPFGERGIVLNVATTRTLDITLRTSALTEMITVTATVPLIQTDPSAGAVVNKVELENLPLNGRQFANLGALAPGTQLAFNADPTKPGQLTVALNGGIGRNVNYIVDGGDNTDDTIGGALQNYSVEGVEEFKIQTQEYKAEYGRSTGGVLSVVSKTGTNELRGSVFGFFRDESLNSRTNSERLAGADKAAYSRQQYGFHSFLVGHQWTLPGGSLNEFILQYSKFKNTISADSTNPALYFPSGVSSGENFNTPQSTEQVKYQFKDDFNFGRTIGNQHHD